VLIVVGGDGTNLAIQEIMGVGKGGVLGVLTPNEIKDKTILK